MNFSRAEQQNRSDGLAAVHAKGYKLRESSLVNGKQAQGYVKILLLATGKKVHHVHGKDKQEAIKNAINWVINEAPEMAGGMSQFEQARELAQLRREKAEADEALAAARRSKAMKKTSSKKTEPETAPENTPTES